MNNEKLTHAKTFLSDVTGVIGSGFLITDLNQNQVMELAKFTRPARDGGGNYWSVVTSSMHAGAFTLRFELQRGWVSQFIEKTIGVKLDEQPNPELLGAIQQLIKGKHQLLEMVVGRTRDLSYKPVAVLSLSVMEVLDAPGYRLAPRDEEERFTLRDLDQTPWTFYEGLKDAKGVGAMYFGCGDKIKGFNNVLKERRIGEKMRVINVSFELEESL